VPIETPRRFCLRVDFVSLLGVQVDYFMTRG